VDALRRFATHFNLRTQNVAVVSHVICFFYSWNTNVVAAACCLLQQLLAATAACRCRAASAADVLPLLIVLLLLTVLQCATFLSLS